MIPMQMEIRRIYSVLKDPTLRFVFMPMEDDDRHRRPSQYSSSGAEG
jgi:hypothetical protein